MFERMLDKIKVPSEAEIKAFIGEKSYSRLEKFEKYLKENYEIIRDLKFPFGNDYGWGYKYSHKLSHLCYVFFEKGAFTITLQIGDKLVPKMEDMLPKLSQKMQNLWEGRYPCGDGGWIHYRVLSDEDVAEVVRLVSIRKVPIKR